ncbi:MAG TPA: spermidine/putrescine ABC transporter substrate-binding protein [Tissierellaceae bacterium]
MNKKFILIFMIIVLVIPLSSCKDNKKQSLNVYNYGDYIDMDIVKEFEEEFNVKVNYNTYATNEDMYIALKKGGTSYDLAFPSDYMIERMIKEDLLEKIDKNIVTNLKYIDEQLLYKEFDPNNDYSVPYFWGTVGIAYNTKYVDEKDVESWDVLWSEKYKNEIFMLDSQRDSFAVALKKLGYSMNSQDINELREATEELIKQKEVIYAYVGDEVKDLMASEEAYIALAWSGDALMMASHNENIAYKVPKEGTNLWFDNVVIPKSGKNKKLANEFINFLNRPEISARNSEYVEYPTANLEGKKLLSEEMRNSETAYPSSEVIKNAEIFRDPKDMLKVYNDLWIEIKATRIDK